MLVALQYADQDSASAENVQCSLGTPADTPGACFRTDFCTSTLSCCTIILGDVRAVVSTVPSSFVRDCSSAAGQDISACTDNTPTNTTEPTRPPTSRPTLQPVAPPVSPPTPRPTPRPAPNPNPSSTQRPTQPLTPSPSVPDQDLTQSPSRPPDAQPTPQPDALPLQGQTQAPTIVETPTSQDSSSARRNTPRESESSKTNTALVAAVSVTSTLFLVSLLVAAVYFKSIRPSQAQPTDSSLTQGYPGVPPTAGVSGSLPAIPVATAVAQPVAVQTVSQEDIPSHLEYKDQGLTLQEIQQRQVHQTIPSGIDYKDQGRDFVSVMAASNPTTATVAESVPSVDATELPSSFLVQPPDTQDDLSC